ncbi:plasmid mobilization relaxosome protein MobC [Erwinia amylovora]|uniref:plasmid mobilization protein n=1 Tax=Erwinia amylovora TaxID=552 RepID=UPI0022ABB500|nr:plasmid mobilization relaxosome protein MobC [Erwinia amylovora]MCZ2719968.1 plasmid mobilization relaxosome protein MobC [Erwinia amylovora]
MLALGTSFAIITPIPPIFKGSFMSRIVKRITPEQKVIWQNFCKDRGISESDMLGLLIEKVTAGQIINPSKGLEEPRTGKVTIRVLPEDIERMTIRAKTEGFPSRTTWLTNLVMATLNKAPVLTDTEINSLRESNRELAAIGRNLNQIARALNVEFRESDRLNREAIEALSSRIEQHKDVVAQLLNRNLNRWGE